MGGDLHPYITKREQTGNLKILGSNPRTLSIMKTFNDDACTCVMPRAQYSKLSTDCTCIVLKVNRLTLSFRAFFPTTNCPSTLLSITCAVSGLMEGMKGNVRIIIERDKGCGMGDE